MAKEVSKERLEAFNKDLEALQNKHNIRIGANLVAVDVSPVVVVGSEEEDVK